MQSKLGSVIKRTFSRLLLLIVVAIILLATYVSVGRQFMPALSGHSEFLEDQIYAATGIPVTVESIEGRFADFNPILEINGLSLPVASEPVGVGETSALVFDSALVEVNMWRSLWQRRWVLEEFSVDHLRLDLVQSDSGQWQVAGMGSSGLQLMGLEALFSALQRVYRLDLNNVAVHMRNRFGEEFSFGDGSAVIQNRGRSHFFHFDSNLQGNSQALQLSMELRGDSLARMEGKIHLRVPQADYSQVLRSFEVEGYQVERFVGGGQLWFSLRQGTMQSATAELEAPLLTFNSPSEDVLALNDLVGQFRLETAADGWSLNLADASLRHEGHYWEGFSATIESVRDQEVSIVADNLDLSFLAAVALDSGLLEPDAAEQLRAYRPEGNIRNLQATLPLRNADIDLSLSANLQNVKLDSVGGSPAMDGIEGFLQLARAAGSSRLDGVVEVESRQFNLQIPSLFQDTWYYDYVNGRLRFAVDSSEGQRITLVSDEIYAESELVKGWVRFTSMQHRLPDGEREAELELLVGTRSVDTRVKSLYLPDGPRVAQGLRNTMQFLDRSILGGDVYDSAVLFRGSTLPGAGAAEKTFQSVFHVRDGEFEFSPEWPVLDSLVAQVITDDANIDIAAHSGNSMDLLLGGTVARIRRDADDRSWLRISGSAAGETAAGLNYLQAAPLGENLRNTFASWQTEGKIAATIGIDLPLAADGGQPELRLEMQLLDNDLLIPQFELELEQVTGPVVFDTRTGLEPTSLTGRLFDQEIAVELASSRDESGDLSAIRVQAAGSVTPQRLANWPAHSEIVRALLARMSGQFSYLAALTIDQSAEEEFNSSLKIQSDLRGVATSLPAPFIKTATASMPFTLQVDRGDDRQRISGDLEELLHFELIAVDDTISSGLILVGDTTDHAPRSRGEPDGGLVVQGEFSRIEIEPWLALMNEFRSDSRGSTDLSESIASVDMSSELVTGFGQRFSDFGFRLEPDSEAGGWRTTIVSEAVEGEALIPFDPANFLKLDFDRIHLAGADPEATETPSTETAERSDPLADLDPRELPPMEFATDSLTIGERDFGSWQFTVNPVDKGVQVTDLAFDFRGLRLGVDEPAADIERLTPGFDWSYDGDRHTSALTGVLETDNIADVLMASGFAAPLISDEAVFVTDIQWQGSPAFFSSTALSGRIDLRLRDGRFLQDTNATGALKLVSILNFSALVRRMRFSDDLMRRGLAFDEISGRLRLDNGLVDIQDRLVISGPSSLYQLTGQVDLAEETIDGEMYVTLPVSDNIPWLGLLTANIPLAVGAYLVGQIFGDQVDSLTSAVYTLKGPWDELQPEFKQAFGSPASASGPEAANN